MRTAQMGSSQLLQNTHKKKMNKQNKCPLGMHIKKSRNKGDSRDNGALDHAVDIGIIGGNAD